MKKMSFCSAIVLLLSFYLGGCSQPQPNPKLDDLNLLCETLETEHYTSTPTFQRRSSRMSGKKSPDRRPT